MSKLLVLSTFLVLARCQNSDTDQSIIGAVNSVFNTSLYEEVTQEPLRSYGALQKCGENERAGLDVCVPYYNCDATTRTVIQDGATDGFGIIDLRYDINDNQCDHFLDICCQTAQGNATTSSTSVSEITSSSTEHQQPFTSPSITNSRPPTSNTPTSTESNDNNELDTGGSWTNCGIRNPNGIDFKLVGNVTNEAQYGEFPWQAALLRTNYDKQLHGHQCICGGSIVRSNVILTAAHCVNDFKPSEITVRVGEWDTQTTKERIPFQERQATRVILHESYGNGAVNDIALILLDQPLTKVKSVGSICLPKTNQVITSKHCLASGWGKANFGKVGEYSVILKKIELPMVQNSDCQRQLRRTRLGSRFTLHRSFTCAGGELGKDTCTGDGGGPLVCPDPNNPDRYVQAGIVSWGVGCGKEGVPGVYTNVANFRQWIDRKLTELGSTY